MCKGAGPRIIRDVVTDRTPLLAEVDRLLRTPLEGDKVPVLDRIDETLTEASACALILEAERLRLERAISRATVAMLGDGRPPCEELGALTRRVQATNRELRMLRAKLRSLRVRQREIRAA